MSLTVIVGQPGSGKSKAIRDRYLKAGNKAVFLDGHHSEEMVRQLRHEMGFFEHRYLFCPPEQLWPELNGIDGESEIFIDMPNLPLQYLDQLRQLSEQKGCHFIVTSKSVPSELSAVNVISL